MFVLGQQFEPTVDVFPAEDHLAVGTVIEVATARGEQQGSGQGLQLRLEAQAVGSDHHRSLRVVEVVGPESGRVHAMPHPPRSALTVGDLNLGGEGHDYSSCSAS